MIKYCALDENNKLFVLNAKNLVAAISEIESMETTSETLIIFERENKKNSTHKYEGVVYTWFNSVLVSNGNGWNVTNGKHGVGNISIELGENANGEYRITAI